MDDDIDLEEVLRVIQRDNARWKDLPTNPRDRAPGINFEGRIGDGRTIRVKVGPYAGRYRIVTVHAVGRKRP